LFSEAIILLVGNADETLNKVKPDQVLYKVNLFVWLPQRRHDHPFDVQFVYVTIVQERGVLAEIVKRAVG